MKIFKPIIEDLATFTGSVDITGSVTVTQNLSVQGQFDGTVTTSSYVELGNVDGFTAFSSSIVSGVSTVSTDLSTLNNKSLISSSAQVDRSWVVGANGFSDYTFSGSGLTGTENDPTLYLTRGEIYRFDIQSGGSHPFRIQSTPNGSVGTQYNDGLSGNDLTAGTLIWNVQFDSPSKLYYQCTNHSSMGGVIHILDKQPDGLISSSLQIASDISGSFTLISASIASDISNLSGKTLISSSAQIASDISGSFTLVSSSFASRLSQEEGSINSINSVTSSFLLNTTDTLTGDLTVTGRVTAQEFHTEFVSASIIYQSGSSKFGDSADDIHHFTGRVGVNKSTPSTGLDINSNTVITGSLSVSSNGVFGGQVNVVGDVVAFFSDERLKDIHAPLTNALHKVTSLDTFYYTPNELAQSFGYENKTHIGVSAQQVEKILPEIVTDAAIGQGYKTLDYSKLVPLLIQSIKELKAQIDELKDK